MLNSLFQGFNMYSNTRCYTKSSIFRMLWLSDCNSCKGKRSDYIRRWDCLNRGHVHSQFQDLYFLASNLLFPRSHWQLHKAYSRCPSDLRNHLLYFKNWSTSTSATVPLKADKVFKIQPETRFHLALSLKLHQAAQVQICYGQITQTHTHKRVLVLTEKDGR